MPNTDKTIFLPQLQRYDEKIKGWADGKFLKKTDAYSLPNATKTTLGGVKVGNGLNVTDDGTLSVETHSNETSITTSITATYKSSGTWNTVCKDTYDVIVSWFDNYDRVFAWVNSGENSLRPFPQDFVELINMQEGLIVSTPFTIQYVAQSNNPRSRIGMTTTALCQIYFNADGSIDFLVNYSGIDQYADATEFTNTVSGNVSKLSIKDGAITEAKIEDSAVSSTKIAPSAVTTDKILDGAITKAKLASNAVTTDKILDGAITKAKLASDVGVGGGNSLTPFTAVNGTKLGNWTISTNNESDSMECCGAYCDDYIYIQSEYLVWDSGSSTVVKITRTDGKKIALGNVATDGDTSSPNTGCIVSIIGNATVDDARLSVKSNATTNSITLAKNDGQWIDSPLCFIIGAFICVKE